MLKIKLRKTDRLFTELVRIIYEYTCQRCRRVYSPDGDLHNLGVSHYYGRAREGTRYDLENCTLLCNMPCHRRWEGEDRAEYLNYMIERLGQEGYDLLTLRANTYRKRDDKLIEMWLKQELEVVPQ